MSAATNNPQRRNVGGGIVACIALLATPCARAQPVADFYRGKTVTLCTAASVGGGYDQYARLLAKHMPRHIPGTPDIVVSNMVGAEGLISTMSPRRTAP